MPKFIRYEIQVGKGKGSYKTKYTTNKQFQARLLYDGLNIHSGYKKRWVEVYSDCRNTVERYISK